MMNKIINNYFIHTKLFPKSLVSLSQNAKRSLHVCEDCCCHCRRPHHCYLCCNFLSHLREQRGEHRRARPAHAGHWLEVFPRVHQQEPREGRGVLQDRWKQLFAQRQNNVNPDPGLILHGRGRLLHLRHMVCQWCCLLHVCYHLLPMCHRPLCLQEHEEALKPSPSLSSLLHKKNKKKKKKEKEKKNIIYFCKKWWIKLLIFYFIQ